MQNSSESPTHPHLVHHGLVHTEAQRSNVLRTSEFEAMNHTNDGKAQGTKLNLVPSNAPATQRPDGEAAAPTAPIHCSTPTVPNNPL